MKQKMRRKLLIGNLIISALAVIGAMVIAGCRIKSPMPGANTGPSSGPQLPPPVVVTPSENTKPKPPASAITVTLTSDKTTYRSGETVRFTITARNTSQQAVTLQFNSGQNFDITAKKHLKTDSPILWQWSHDKMFTMALRQVKFAPGEKQTWTATWDQTDSEGNILPRGNYTIEAKLTANSGIPAAPILIGLID